DTARGDLDGAPVPAPPLVDVVAARLGAPFVFPAVASARQASGAVWIKVPMPFRERMRITTTRSPDYPHVNSRTFGGAGGIRTFDPDEPARDVLSALRAGGRPL